MQVNNKSPPLALGSLVVIWGLSQKVELNDKICRVLRIRETKVDTYEVALLSTGEKYNVMVRNLFQITEKKVIREKGTLIGLNLSGRHITGVNKLSAAHKCGISAPCRIELIDTVIVQTAEHFKDLVKNKDQFVLGYSRIPQPIQTRVQQKKPFISCSCLCQLCMVFMLMLCIIIGVSYALYSHFEGSNGQHQFKFQYQHGAGGQYHQRETREAVKDVELTNYFEVLGITKQPSEVTNRDINDGYQKASRKYHPDKNSDPSAAGIYTQVREAYDVLKNPRRRAIFEAFGINDKLHEKLLPERAGNDVSFELRINFEDLYNGASHSVSVSRHKLNNQKHVVRCQSCKKQPPEYQRSMFGMMQVGPDCRSVCQTTTQQLVTEYVDLTIDIEKGMRSGEQIRFPYMGNRYVDYIPSDIVFTISPLKHEIFTRRGSNLYVDLTISLLDAVVGFQTTIPHLDSHKVSISAKEPSPHGTILSFKGEGMPSVEGDVGDLMVTLGVAFPKTITAQQNTDLIKLFVSIDGEESVAEQLQRDANEDSEEDTEEELS